MTEDKRDIPSPVLTGQVQRVWISAGSMRGTPCQSSSLAASLLRLTTSRVRPGTGVLLRRSRAAPAVQAVAGGLQLRRRHADAEDDRLVGRRGLAADVAAAGALASWTAPAAAGRVASRCSTDVSLAAPWARLALRFRRPRRPRDVVAAASWSRSSSCRAAACGRRPAVAACGRRPAGRQPAGLRHLRSGGRRPRSAGPA